MQWLFSQEPRWMGAGVSEANEGVLRRILAGRSVIPAALGVSHELHLDHIQCHLRHHPGFLYLWRLLTWCVTWSQSHGEDALKYTRDIRAVECVHRSPSSECEREWICDVDAHHHMTVQMNNNGPVAARVRHICP